MKNMPRPFPGGPMGGPRGPMGGPMMGGPRFNRPFPHFDYNIPSAPRQQGVPVGTSMVTTFTHMQIDAGVTFHHAIKRKGKIGGVITGFRIILSGGLRNQIFQGRMETIDMQLAENRITASQAKKRKMDAAKKYNRYLLKTGYINREEYVYGMQQFAEKIGVQYVDDTQDRTRTR